MLNKTVIVTGAGFSYPANIPIQNRIIDEMLAKSEIGFMDNWEQETYKFYKAYIEFGIFLIENYTKISGKKYKNKIQKIIEDDARMRAEHAFIKTISKDSEILKEIQKTEALKKLFLDKQDKEEAVLNNQLIKQMANLKEEVRATLESQIVKVDLEDLFTKLDKCVKNQSYWKDYSFLKVAQIRQYILQLFIYYFAKKNEVFQVNDNYQSFSAFVKEKKPSVITTNWDTLCEQIFDVQGIGYDLCLEDSYYHSNCRKRKPQIAKIHGSINWFSCSNCGSLVIKNKGEESDFLLGDKITKCSKCKVEQQNEDFLFVPEIITPTMVKTFTKQMYTNIWQNAEYILKDANEVYFIGYSMPLADFEFRYMLTKFISPNAKIRVILHTTDEKKCGEEREVPEDRYRCAFPKNEIEFFYKGFTEYFNNL
jgi:NAD-dependent SIR2 family protein deacetylase